MATRRPSRPAALAALLALVGAETPLMAEAMYEPIDTLALQVANRVGVLRFCAVHGFATPADIARARAVLANDPQKPPAEKLAEAEANGSEGRILAGERYIAMADLVAQSGYDVKQTCAGVAASAEVAAQSLAPR